MAENEFDLLIIGAGIYGAASAWEAASRGLKVALIDKGDFASGTSSNSLKIIHGGLRYLQHADFRRMRESITERRILMHIAPHLVHPLPCVMPTYGHLVKGPEVMRFALLLNDIISFDRNQSGDPQKHLPMGRILSKEEIIHQLPFIDHANLTSGALWYDARMHSSERLVLAFIKSASRHGAVIANYVKADSFIFSQDRVTGIMARDAVTGDRFTIRAKLTLNTAGPWINKLLASLNGWAGNNPFAFSTALNLVVNRRFTENTAFGFSSEKVFKDSDALISKGSRLLFAVPWRNITLFGTEHAPYSGEAERFRVTEEMIGRFLDEINSALPEHKIERDEVVFHYGGLLPMTGVNQKTGDVTLVKHFHLIDHKKEHGPDGLVSVLSVKFTTARDVAQKAVDLVFRKLKVKFVKSETGRKRLVGGDIDDFSDHLQNAIARKQSLTKEAIVQLAHNYGSEYGQVLQLANGKPHLSAYVDEERSVPAAEVVHAVKEEMALTLADVVFRRTQLGSAGNPGETSLGKCAEIMAGQLGWSAQRTRDEIQSVINAYALSS